MTRCEAECDRLGLPTECGVLLWAVCASLRDRIEGSIALDRQLMKREDSAKVVSTAPYVESLPMFGGELSRSVAPGAVTRL